MDRRAARREFISTVLKAFFPVILVNLIGVRRYSSLRTIALSMGIYHAYLMGFSSMYVVGGVDWGQ